MNPMRSGHFTVVNGTRYNTDEITALFDAVVDHYVQRGFTVKHAHEETAMGTVLDVCDYNPSSPWDTTRSWDADTNTYVTKRERAYVKRAGYTLTTRFKMGLLPPEKLYENPLEALVSAEGEERAPAIMTQRVLERFHELIVAEDANGMHRYNWELRNSVIQEVVAANQRGLLIEKKRGEVNKADKRLREKRLAAQRSLSLAGYDIRQAIGCMISAEGVTKAALDACKTADVPPMFDATLFDTCIAYLRRVAEGMERTIEERLKA